MTADRTFVLKMVVHLAALTETGVWARHPYGPRFHRWWPDGEADKIDLPTGTDRVDLQAWFERRGVVNSSFVYPDLVKGGDVPPELIERQAAIDVGPLCARLVYRRVSSEDWDGLISKDPTRYEAIGKAVLKSFVWPALSSLIETLRVDFGQYWLIDLPAWDSQHSPLANYWHSELHARYSVDGGIHWEAFEPGGLGTQSTVLASPTGRDFQQYITRDDWETVLPTRLAKRRTAPSGVDGDDQQTAEMTAAAEMAYTRALQFADGSDARLAFVEAVTALELALGVVTRTVLSADSEQAPSLRFRVLEAAALTGRSDPETLQNALLGIRIRNGMIHQGNVPAEISEALSALIRITGQLLEIEPRKTPSQYHRGNMAMSDEQWDKEYERESASITISTKIVSP